MEDDYFDTLTNEELLNWFCADDGMWGAEVFYAERALTRRGFEVEDYLQYELSMDAE
jgi:hypothetical protein